jgi:hypothetical protein
LPDVCCTNQRHCRLPPASTLTATCCKRHDSTGGFKAQALGFKVRRSSPERLANGPGVCSRQQTAFSGKRAAAYA